MGYLPSVMIIDNVCVQEINTITTRKHIFAINQTYLMSGIRVLNTYAVFESNFSSTTTN